MEKFKVVYLEWIDSTSHGNTWTSKKSVEELTPEKIQTIGYLIKETPHHITIVTSLSEYQYGGDICIPKFAITKRKYINVKT